MRKKSQKFINYTKVNKNAVKRKISQRFELKIPYSLIDEI